MLTVNLGPLMVAMSHLLLLISLLLAILTGWWLGRGDRCNPEKQLFRLLLLAVLVARLAFVLVYFDAFKDDLWRMLDIRDGGFIAWPGLVAALLMGIWLIWRSAALRKPLGAALAVGVLTWGMGGLALHSYEQAIRLPPLSLRDAGGKPVELQSYLGKPLVVNLWATWCPPCRREMPVLAEAQRREEGLVFLFVNQGEGTAEVMSYLASQGLELENVVLDSGARLGQQVGSMALPTTLFYSAEGRQLGSHLGELSPASLARSLTALRKEGEASR